MDWQGPAEAGAEVVDSEAGLDADTPLGQAGAIVDREVGGMPEEVARDRVGIIVEPGRRGFVGSDGHGVATPLGPSCRTKVKEFTQLPMPKPLENGPSQGRISALLSQPSCPSIKAMGR